MSRTKRACCGPMMGHPAAWLLVGLAVLASNRLARSAADSLATCLGERPPVKTNLFEAGKDGYVTYRIPAIVVTKRGVVLAYCAARKSGSGDWDHIDIAMRRSTDGGRTWQPREDPGGRGQDDDRQPHGDRRPPDRRGPLPLPGRLRPLLLHAERRRRADVHRRRWTSPRPSSSSARSTTGT